MTEFTITLPVGYIIRDEIKAFRPDQWASYFDKICATVGKKNVVFLTLLLPAFIRLFQT